MFNMKLTRFIFIILFAFSLSLFFPQKVKAFSECWSGTCPAEAYYSMCNPPAGCPGDGIQPWCDCLVCPCAGCEGVQCWCCPCSSPPSCGGACFTGETEIGVKNSKTPKLQTEKIENLKPGDVVESFDPKTGEIKEGTVSDVTKTMREGYYILETESGEKVKVTGEHPFLAVKAKNSESRVSPAERDPASRDTFQLISNLKNILSNTLTYKVITSLQEKIGEVLK
jgi:hypothetical protein